MGLLFGAWLSDARSAQENRDRHGIGTIEGELGTYDGSGYSVDYRLTVSDPDPSITQQYRSLGDDFQLCTV